MNNGWHDVNDLLPKIGLMVWVTDENGRLAFGERQYKSSRTNEWQWCMSDWEFFYKEDGLIDVDFLYKDITPKYWHELPQLPNIVQ